MNSLTLSCPAKVNLYLKVVARRPDGYHDLVTVMQPLSLADELILTLRAAAISLECNRPDLPVDEGNLAVRAALAFQKATSQTFGLHLRLDKKIPVAAGLGGGSSNAAGVLRGLNLLRGKPLNDRRLQQLARSPGRGCPFFSPGRAGSGPGDWRPAYPHHASGPLVCSGESRFPGVHCLGLCQSAAAVCGPG